MQVNIINRSWQLSRRNLLKIAIGAAAMVPVATLLGCPGTTTSVSSWVQVIEDIGTEAVDIVPQLEAAGMSAASGSTVQSIVTEIQAAASAIGSSSTATQGQSTLQQIEGYINSLAPLVAPFVALVPGGAVISIIIAALPLAESALNMITALTSQAQSLAAQPASAALKANSLAAAQAAADKLHSLAQAKRGILYS